MSRPLTTGSYPLLRHGPMFEETPSRCLLQNDPLRPSRVRTTERTWTEGSFFDKERKGSQSSRPVGPREDLPRRNCSKRVGAPGKVESRVTRNSLVRTCRTKKPNFRPYHPFLTEVKKEVGRLHFHPYRDSPTNRRKANFWNYDWAKLRRSTIEYGHHPHQGSRPPRLSPGFCPNLTDRERSRTGRNSGPHRMWKCPKRRRLHLPRRVRSVHPSPHPVVTLATIHLGRGDPVDVPLSRFRWSHSPR